MIRHVLRIPQLRASQGPAAHELRHATLLFVGQTLDMNFHDAVRKCRIDPLGRHSPDCGWIGRTAGGRRIPMTAHAARLKNSESGFGP